MPCGYDELLRIKSIRKNFSSAATETLVLSPVISHLNYYNVILYGIANSDIHKLQRIQNMCLKLVLNCRKFASSKDALFKLHWLPVKVRITFKILTYMYNCSIWNAPTYLTEPLTEKHVGLRSTVQESFILYDVPFNKKLTFWQRFHDSWPKTGERLTN